MIVQHDIDRIVETYSTTLLRMAMHYVSSQTEAEDIVQNVYIKYLHKAPEFKDEHHELAWLLRVTSNAGKDANRTWWKRQTTELRDDVSNRVEVEQTTLLYLIRKLPPSYKNAIYLHYYEGYKVAWIAEIYHVKETTVASWLHRGRKKLKVLMEGDEFYEE